MTDRICVIIPTYNRAGLIAESIDSLLTQTRPIDDILVVDDGSTDNTKEVVDAYGDAVRYIFKENGGRSSGANLGIAQTTADLIWICDDDDIILPEACALLMSAFEEDPGLGFCAGRHIDFVVDEDTGEKQYKPPGHMRDSKPDEIFSDLLDGVHIFQPGLVVRRATYDAVGPFDEIMTRSQDIEILLRIARRHRGRLLEEIVFHHREHGGDRGKAGERFKVEQSNNKWIEFHRIIMEPLIPDLSDAELLPMSIWQDPDRAETRTRTARVKRATVYGRNQLWPEAVEHFAQTAAEFSGPLDEYERGLVSRCTHYSLGCDGLLYDTEVRNKALALKSQSALGKEICRLLGRSLHWRLKDAIKAGDLARSLNILRFIAASY